MDLKQMLQDYQVNPTPEQWSEIANALGECRVYVPAAASRHVVPAEGNLMGVKPDTIPAGEGRVLFPVFSDPSQIPDAYGFFRLLSGRRRRSPLCGNRHRPVYGEIPFGGEPGVRRKPCLTPGNLV